MENDTFYGNFYGKINMGLSGNLIYHVFSIKTSDNLQTNFTMKSP